MTKSTHQGSCQICGSVQCLPGGVLAKHGYTTRWGFFEGTCSGSGWEPFELSKDLVEPAVMRCKATIESILQEVANYENMASEVNGRDVAWHVVSVGRDRMRNWEQVKLVQFESEIHGSGEDARTLYRIMGRDSLGKLHQIHNGCNGPWSMKLSSVRAWAHAMNAEYVRHLRSVISARRDWVKWQEERLANWSVKPLIARKA